MYETLSNIDHIRLNFSEGGLMFMNITLGVIMFGVALGIKVDNFKSLFYNPKSAILGVFRNFFYYLHLHLS